MGTIHKPYMNKNSNRPSGNQVTDLRTCTYEPAENILRKIGSDLSGHVGETIDNKFLIHGKPVRRFNTYNN